MSLGLAYWICILIWLVLGVWSSWPSEGKPSFKSFGGDLFLFLLFVLLGWRVFGAPIHS